ncbi:ATS12 metalloproteinase, partial [Atractosteus spatula]|nr:ATS12 metalloproteinase [Atractosteus spatula]
KAFFVRSPQEQFLRSQREFAVVHPQKVGRDGEFVSHNLAHHIKQRSKRDVEVAERRVFYKLNHNGQDMIFNLTVNHHLLSREYFLEWRSGSPNATKIHSSTLNSCHFMGTVENSSSVAGVAAISTCNGLRGFFSLPEGSYFIEPVREHEPEEGEQQPHVIYQSSFPQQPQRQRRSAELHHGRMPCGLKDSYLDSLRTERRRENWERKHSREGRQIAQRSVSKERWVETLVVADPKMIEYHGIENVESYVFTIMNMVTGIFHDATIGNAIHIVLVRLILLQEEEKGLKIVHHADNTLASFCTWQKSINPQSDTHPAHHDVAVLITRQVTLKDICAGMNKPCETLGLSHLSGMCQAHRSCNINEDSGLPVAFTVAHELGHSFGIHHDGQGNDCEQGRHPFIMSRQLQYDASPLTWSTCSKDYITRFLDRGWGSCLDDRPSKKDLTAPAAAPGVLYTIHQQCQLQYGPSATFCEEVENVCQTLWCSVNGSCRSKLDSPADGTRCGEDKWCISGECVIVGKLPETVNGGWGVWSRWSHCTRTCGAGVQSAERECNNPKPEYGGKYCTGERKRYRICNTKACPKDKPTFREMQCSEFDTVPYKNELYEWIPVANLVNPCELNCRPVDEQFSEKMLDAVTDGTPCFMNNSSRNICINGICKAVGCDYAIDSNAVEDRCGICLGDGSSCHTVRKTFDAKEGSGYVDVGMIPEGARDIVVKEVEEAGNFLVLRSEDPEKYYLNGNFIIQWNGEYLAGGTTFYYERKGNLENLTSPGPTREPVWLQLLFQEQNPGIEYEYTIRNSRVKGNDISVLEYKWKYGAWTDCSATCGTGFQRQPVRCFETETGVVEETLCDPDTRPLDRQRKCKTMDCPARWWVGSWQLCSATCGPSGVKKRTVLCVRTVGEEERVLPLTECKHLLKPKSLVPCNREVLCGPEWAVGNWSKALLAQTDKKKKQMTEKHEAGYSIVIHSSLEISILHTCIWETNSKGNTVLLTYNTFLQNEPQLLCQTGKTSFDKEYLVPLICSEGCTEATKVRDVQCIDTQSKRQLRPFHCQALAFKPSVSAPCNHQRCLEWRLSPWSKCSKSCGPGLRERLVYCPEYNRCNLKERPSSTEPCSERLCTKWVADAWEEGKMFVFLFFFQYQCTVTCGGGVQHRVVNCVNEETKNVENNSLCEKTTRPDSFQKCHLQECEKSKELSCSKNHMSTRFCEKLKLLGRCSVSSIRKQCCSTCAA